MSETTANLEDYRWLASQEGAEWLSRVQDDSSTPLHQLAAKLRKKLSANRAQLVLAQRAWRQRAGRRFPWAEQMLWTARGVEQATSWRLASYKASRFRTATCAMDLCCGVGGDLLAIAEHVATIAVDRDPICAFLAEYHLGRLTSGGAHCVHQADVCHIALPLDAAIHIDPDRRPHGRRSIELQHHQPDGRFLERLVDHPSGVAIKLAPATQPEQTFLEEAELEWLGHGRQCQQLVAWFGKLAERPQHRRATIIGADGIVHSIIQNKRWAPTKWLELAADRVDRQVQQFVVEPHAPILAAGLVPQLAVEHRLTPLTERGGYLTGDRVASRPWWQRFEVLDVRPFREQQLARWLGQHDVGQLEVKKRGARIDPLRLQRRFSRPEGHPATLFVISHQRQRIAVLTRRCG